MKATFLLAFAFLLLGRNAPAADAQAEVLQTDADYRAAVLRGDAAKLATIFADDILIVHSDGGTDTKANFLDAISSGRLKLLSYDRRDIQVRAYGPVALLFSRTAKTFTYKGGPGKADDTSIVTFSKVGNRWKIAAMQNTPRSE
jgi:uncharacterized protein (TIGR02246 family)